MQMLREAPGGHGLGVFLHAGAPTSYTAGLARAACCRLLQKENTMADDLSKRGPQDATRIIVNELHEVRYWTQALGVTEAQLRSAIAAAGVEVRDVRVYLGKPERA
jgi:hypothetical protein